MKKGLFYFLLLCCLSSFSQTYLKGKVLSNNNIPLEGASVYFNNTTIGDVTNTKGEFNLKAKKGQYLLIVSFLGYKTKQVSIALEKDLNFDIKLEEDNTVLNDVLITKTIYDEDWKYNLKLFKTTFFGKSKLAKNCKILNEKDLHFDFNIKTNTLTAFAKKPLIIKHKDLGYLITYDLVDFSIQGKRSFFSGYAKYENLKKRPRKKIIKNRLKAYNGSQMHFLRSLLHKNLTKEGFVVNQFKRVLNPERPTENQIKMARELVRLYPNKINFSKTIIKPKTPIDSAIVLLRKVSLPKYRDYLYKRNIPYNEMISFDENKNPLIDFKDHLSVIYKNEVEENNYLMGMFGKMKKQTGVQTSNIVLVDGKSKIDNSGTLENPQTIINEGYWVFEAFATMLPLDYKP